MRDWQSRHSAVALFLLNTRARTPERITLTHTHTTPCTRGVNPYVYNICTMRNMITIIASREHRVRGLVHLHAQLSAQLSPHGLI